MTGFLRFKIGDLLCALPIGRVREILPMADLIRPPRQPRLLEGYLNLGGVAVPVLRMDRLLNVVERELSDSDHLILVRLGDRSVALHVERALALEQVEAQRMLSGDFARLSPCVSAEFSSDAGPVHVLDVDRVLADVERGAVDEFALEVQKRFLAAQGSAA